MISDFLKKSRTGKIKIRLQTVLIEIWQHGLSNRFVQSLRDELDFGSDPLVHSFEEDNLAPDFVELERLQWRFQVAAFASLGAQRTQLLSNLLEIACALILWPILDWCRISECGGRH